MYHIKRGLDLPVTGTPEQKVLTSPQVTKVAVVGPDFHGLKPTMKVKVGDSVKKGTLLFLDKKNEGVKYTSPVAGKVMEVNRGERRMLLSVVISISGQETESFKSYKASELPGLAEDTIRQYLLDTGLWVNFRTRPFSRTPAVDQKPHSIFVTAMDTNPLAAAVAPIIKGQEEDFLNGISVLEKLAPKVYVCTGGGSFPQSKSAKVEMKTFSGPHPAGLVGTHMHFVDPVGKAKTNWSINYQDVIAIGKTFTSGQLNSDRIISIAGPMVKKPALVKTVVGASMDELTKGRLKEGTSRLISGSILSGRKAHDQLGYLGRFHYQVSVLEEGTHREFLGWQKPGFGKFSIKNIFASKLTPGKKFSFTTSTEGSVRAMVPIGSYEKVMPLDVEPTHLLRAVITQDTEQGQLLGFLELDEEDLSLCTFVCPTKVEYGDLLRQSLTKIEKDG